jgi:hypothetical protein
VDEPLGKVNEDVEDYVDLIAELPRPSWLGRVGICGLLRHLRPP